MFLQSAQKERKEGRKKERERKVEERDFETNIKGRISVGTDGCAIGKVSDLLVFEIYRVRY